MERLMTDRNRQRARRKTSYVARVYSLNEVAARIGLSERWVRELIKLHGLNIRRVPCAGSGQFIFSRDDLQQIERIHVRNQEELRRRAPALFAVVGKMRPFTTPVNDEREILRDRRM